MAVGVSTYPDTRRALAVRLALAFMTGLALVVSGCAKRTLPSQPPSAQADSALPGSLQPAADVPGGAFGIPQGNKVGFLVPLSGQHQALGQALLNAAQLALFDIADDRFELVVRDTKATPAGAQAAAQEALAEGASLILGPLFATSVTAAAPVAQAAGVNMVAFSNDVSVAGPGVYLMGILPQTQVARVTGYASRAGLRRFGLLAPNTAFGHVVAVAFRDTVARNGAEVANVQFYEPATADLAEDVKRFAASARYDAVMAPAGGGELQQIAALLPYYDIDPARVRYMGTVLWDEPGVMTEPSMQGSWIAAPAPGPRESFARRYQETFGSAPPKIASLGYDAVALAAALMRGVDVAAAGPAAAQAITQPSGFAGIDGIFRFRPDGSNERGLAVLELRGNQYQVIDPAPQSFEALVF
jgi:ABC-type branched-subunit amino acid transport system substrate-binding protein